VKTVRVSAKGGRYDKGVLSAGVFTPEQTRYIQEELEKIVAVIANHDEALDFVRIGAATPEAAVTAPVGTLYVRTDGGTNTTLYVKEAGTGNTGWVAK